MTIRDDRSTLGTWLPVGLLATVRLLLHFVCNARGGYGYFRDELYYLASTSHLDWGYVDHPPLSIWILSVIRPLFGDSIFALRLLPAIAGAMTVVVVALLARELGGGRWAMALAAAASLIAPIQLAFGTIYSMNAFDVLIWATTGLLLAKLINGPSPRLWLVLGLCLGVGLMNKASILWLGAGLFVAIVASPLRRELRTRWPWLAAAIALLLFSPFILWNLQNDMAHAEFIANAVGGKYSGLGIVDLLAGQILLNHPANLPIWLGGLGFLLFGAGKRHRAVGITIVSVIAILIINGSSKPEYLAGAMAMALAAGGVALERWLRHRAWMRPAALTLLVLGLVTTPLAIPILPVEGYVRFAQTLGLQPHTAENKELAELPQFYADMFGWPEKAEAVAAAYRSLPAHEQESVAIFGGNYGRAGAIDFFGPELGLPSAISPHNSYWLWGPGETDYEVILFLGGERERLEEYFGDVQAVGRADCTYCMPYEDNLTIWAARRPRTGFDEVWDQIKSYG